MKKKVIKFSNLPSKPPVWQTIVSYTALDNFNAPEWLWGAVALLILIMWIGWIWVRTVQEEVDLFEDKKTVD